MSVSPGTWKPLRSRHTAAYPAPRSIGTGPEGSDLLALYVKTTHNLGWIAGEVLPLPWQEVIACFEEDGRVENVRARYDARLGGWSPSLLRGRKLYWLHYPPRPRLLG